LRETSIRATTRTNISHLLRSAQGKDKVVPSGVFDLNQLQLWGKDKGWCPYFLTRNAIAHASVIVFNYQYILDPKISKLISSELEGERARLRATTKLN